MRFLFLLLALMYWALLAYSQESLTVSAGDNVYRADGAIHVDQIVNGDLAAAGGKISVAREVKGDAALAAGDVRIDAEIGGDLRTAGGNVDVAAAVKGEVIAVGGNVNIAPAARITGRAWLAAGNARVAGNVGSGITVYARNIALGGNIGGNAHLVGETIEILPGARIQGRLSYRSPNAIKTDATATIAGGMGQEPFVHGHTVRRAGRVAAWIFGAMWGIGVFAVGVLLIALLPRASRTVERTLAQAPWQSLGAGLALLVAIPVVVMILLVTIVGIPLAAVVLAIYPLLLLLGYLMTLLFIGDRAAAYVRKEAEPGIAARIVALALALLVAGLLSALPLVGPLVNSLALLFGLGALALTLYRHFATPDHPDATPTQQQPPPALTGSPA